jgi:hypothetical protein
LEKNIIHKQKIKESDNIDEIKKFVEENCLIDYIKCDLNIVLYHNNKLVFVICFNNNKIELFCSKINTTVIGGLSKVLNYYIIKYKPEQLFCSLLRDYSNSYSLQNLNFQLIEKTKPQTCEILLNNKSFTIYNTGQLNFKLNF